MDSADCAGSVPDVEFCTEELDVSVVVGRTMELFSKQHPGKPLAAKAIQARDGIITLDRGGREQQIDRLVSGQKVTARFEYRGQQVSVKAVFRRTDSGKNVVILGDRVVPLARRRFPRWKLPVPVRLAVLNATSFHPARMARLRWLQTDTVDCSCGGALIDLSSYMESDTYLLMNVAVEDVPFPTLVVGRVRHCLQGEIGHFLTGVEFITDECLKEAFPTSTLRNLPQVVFEYTSERRQHLAEPLARQAKSESKDGIS